MRNSRFLADGPERLLRDTGIQAELDLAVADIEAKYALLLKKAGFIRRFELHRKMRREIEREIEHAHPARPYTSVRESARRPLAIRLGEVESTTA